MTATTEAETNETDLTKARSASPSWQSQITEIIHRRNLSIQEQTPASAAALLKQFGYFGDGVTMPHEVEQNLFEAFIEDDYDGALHLSTIMQETTSVDGGGSILLPIGLIFWREMPEKEVQQWIHYERLGQLARQWYAQVKAKILPLGNTTHENNEGPALLALDDLGSQMFGGSSSPDHPHHQQQQQQQQRQLSEDPDKHLKEQPATIPEKLPSWEYDEDEPHRVRHSLTLTRQESLKWLGKLAGTAATSTAASSNDEPTKTKTLDKKPTSISNTKTSSLVSSSPSQTIIPLDYAQSWVKIELLAVRQPWWGQKIGSLLLASAMYQAWRRKNKRTVLHIAGGSSNVPALKLYHKFGFLPAKGLFHKPNKDIYVLGNIELALQSILWEDILTLHGTTTSSHHGTSSTTTTTTSAKSLAAV